MLAAQISFREWRRDDFLNIKLAILVGLQRLLIYLLHAFHL